MTPYRWDLEPLDSPSDVELYTSPWVSGTRAVAYFGPLRAEVFLQDGLIDDRQDSWEKLERELLEAMRDQARPLGANAVIALEVTLDPFVWVEGCSGLRMIAHGTAAKLEPLF